MPHRIIKSIDGRRGGALALVSTVFLALGWSQLRDRPDGRSRVLSWLPDWFGNDDLGMILIVAAGLALVCALVSKWSKRALALGYGLMFITASLLAVLYAVASVAGMTAAVSSAAIFAGFAGLIYTISNWDEPHSSPPLTDEQREFLGGGSDG